MSLSVTNFSSTTEAAERSGAGAAVASELADQSGTVAAVATAEILEAGGKGGSIPLYVGELWTARQRQMHPIHYAVSYRAAFKPELPQFFICRYLVNEGLREGIVLDPFSGRGTTVLQSNFSGFRAIGNDLNPVANYIACARQYIPPPERLLARLDRLDLAGRLKPERGERERLSPFFHERTLSEILKLRRIIAANSNMQDRELAVISLAALSRLHGHSDGFFSAYSFPQISIMPAAQRRNNDRRGIKPQYRSVKERIARKLRSDFFQELPERCHHAATGNRYLQKDARDLSVIAPSSVDLIVTSPPFLDKVNYRADNWLRAWFLHLEEELNHSPLLITADAKEWGIFMADVMREMGRLLKPGARAVLEVGDVRSTRAQETLNLEEILLSFLPLKLRRGWLIAEEIWINQQNFTKLANCWHINNNLKGTNTNRCLVLRRV